MNAPITQIKTSGWQAKLHLAYADRAGRTRLIEKQQSGPLTVQRPFYPEKDVCHSYLLHPPGGVVGGDQLNIQVKVKSGAHALVTTPGATKFYRSGDRLAVQRQCLSVEQGGVLEWFPQEAIFFPGCDAELETEINLEADAQFIGWDLLCLGRPSLSERFEQGSLQSRIKLKREGRLQLVDQFFTEGEQMSHSASGLRGHPMLATLLATGVDKELLAEVQQLCLENPTITSGATLLDDLLVVRALGERTEHLLQHFCAIWQLIRPQLLGKTALAPRIWAT